MTMIKKLNAESNGVITSEKTIMDNRVTVAEKYAGEC